MPMLE
jgi:hypothetical protein